MNVKVLAFIAKWLSTSMSSLFTFGPIRKTFITDQLFPNFKIFLLGIVALCFYQNTLAQCDNYLDYFETTDYAGNDGNANWLGTWVEGGDDGSAASGFVFVDPVLQELRMQGDGGPTGACRYIERQVDLSTNPDYVSAILTVDYEMISVTGPINDNLSVQVSGDGGATFTTLGYIDGNSGGENIAYYDVSSYIGSVITVRFEVCGFAQAGESFSIRYGNVYACEERVVPSGCSAMIFDWADVNGVGQTWNMDDQSNTYNLTTTDGDPVTVTVNLIDPNNRNGDSDVRDVGSHPFDPAGGCGYYTGNGEEADWANLGSITDPWDSDCRSLWTQTNGSYGPDYLTWVMNSQDHTEEVTLEFCFSDPVFMEDFRISDIDFSGHQWTVDNVAVFETPGNTYQDEVFIYALDASGDTVDVDVTALGNAVTVNSSPTVDQAIANYDTNVQGDIAPTDVNGEISISSSEVISCLYLVYSNGIADAIEEQANPQDYTWWSDTNGATNGVSDNHAIRIDGFNACVCQPFAINITSDTVCVGEVGSIVINSVSGGIPPYMYQWQDADSTTTDTIVFLSPDTITYQEVVIVTDAEGCSDSIVGLIDVVYCCMVMIDNITVGPCDPETQTFDVDVTISYVDVSGDIDVNGTTFTPNGSGTETITLAGLPADGTTGIPITANSLADMNCEDATSYDAPPPCCPIENCLPVTIEVNGP